MSSAERMKRAVRAGGVACFAAAVCLAAAAPAVARPVYTFGGYVGGEFGSHGGKFGLASPDGVAVDPTSGDLYVVDGDNRRIQKFDSELTPGFLAAWGWKVNEGGREAFEICTGSSKCTEGAGGGGAGEFSGEVFEQAVGVAVDSVDHDVYATDSVNNRVEYFEADGNYLHQFNGTEIDGTTAAKRAPEGLSFPIGIAADSSGHVYVEDRGHNVVDRFSASGEYECQMTGKTPGSGTECDPSGSKTSAAVEGFSLGSADGAGLAVDSSGNVYVADTGNNVVDEFSSSGAFVRAFGEGVLSSPQAVSVDNAGDVFVASGESTVHEFDPTGAKIAEFNADSPSGEPAQIYGLAATADGSRVYVANQSIVVQKEVLVYARLATATTEVAATPVLGSATLRGTVNPNGLPVEACVFEWGEGSPGGAFEHPAPCVQSPAEIGSGESPVPVSAEVSGLTPFDLYHYRVVARNAAGPTYGGDIALLAGVDVFGFQSGGANALEMNVSNPNSEAEEEKPPSIEENGWQVANPAAPDSQAGSHPFAVTTRFLVNTESNDNLPPSMAPKDYYVNIPAGFAGSVARIPRCKMSELSEVFLRSAATGCPTASQVGVVRIFEPNSSTGRVEEQELRAVYNMVPPPGVPAELAFSVGVTAEPVIVRVRSDSDYGVTAEVRNVSEKLQIAGSELTLWGVPANAAHDKERFLPAEGVFEEPGNHKGESLPAGTPEVPFLTNPSRCGSVEEATVMADSWSHPGKLAEDGRPLPGSENWVTVHTPMYPKGITGCGKLTFQPQIEVKPSTSVADSPMGMTIDLRVPQNEDPHNLATPALRSTTVTLPQGVSISSAQGNDLEGCTPAQIKLHSEAAPECPNGSQVGKLELTTPLLPEPLSGRVYLGSQHSGNVFHMFLVIHGQGVLVKLEGSVEANERTGQLTGTFTEDPQLPFSDLKLTFYGGSNAALATPQQCGSYTTTSLLEPWSHYEADGEATGTPNAAPSIQPFTIVSGCGNGFAPGFAAGVANPVAGAYSPFELSFSRQDGEQDLSGLQVKMPVGLVGKLAGVAECSNAQIEHAKHNTGAAEKAAPSCPVGSEVGSVEAGSGPGEHPFFLPGKAYLTGPYEGAPYGIAVVVPALAGPFDLGTVVVRSKIEINSHTSQVTVMSDLFPQMLDGIPLRVRRVDVHVSRPRFTLNPTSCQPSSVSGVLTSVDGAQHAVSSRFQVGDCGSLLFKPGFHVFTHAAHTRRFGEYLRVKVTSGGGQTNIKSVHVELPKRLPSRVATLKLACAAKQFAENPAGCPADSHVGSAIARTPILGVPLTGPAIFVSHGGAAFPDLDIVLQGSGITVVLEGNTNIVKNITSSDFKSVPDVPVSSFELMLPEGKYSALDAKGNLCYQTVSRHKHSIRKRRRLIMPTTIKGQNGAQLKQNTVINVSGCGKTKAAASKHGQHKKKK